MVESVTERWNVWHVNEKLLVKKLLRQWSAYYGFKIGD
jgi:hypothetical protein